MITATQAARKMMAERGYVVIGYPARYAGSATLGMRIDRFAGKDLDGVHLRVDSATDRDDWDAQCAAIFGSDKKGKTGKNRPSDGEEFFRCTLVAEAERGAA